MLSVVPYVSIKKVLMTNCIVYYETVNIWMNMNDESYRNNNKIH